MAKKKPVNKTEMIREYYKKNGKATPTDIVAEMKKRNVAVTANYVSNVKSGMKKKTTKMKAVKKKAAKKSDKLSLGDLVKASRLAEELGGVDKAQEMLNALAKLK